MRGVAGRRVVVVLSGGNIDLPLLQAVVRRGLTVCGRYLVLRTRILDRPGLADEAARAARRRAREHRRRRPPPRGLDILVTDTEVELTVETRDAEHAHDVVALPTGKGYDVERVR